MRFAVSASRSSSAHAVRHIVVFVFPFRLRANPLSRLAWPSRRPPLTMRPRPSIPCRMLSDAPAKARLPLGGAVFNEDKKQRQFLDAARAVTVPDFGSDLA